MNDQIRSPQVRLIDHEGKNIGIVSISVALERARDKDLDLVEVSSDSNPPTCKIMDFKRHFYDQKKRLKENRKKSKNAHLKQIRLSPTIGEHDLEVKFKQILSFINGGHQVKINMRFKGRQREHLDVGKAILTDIVDKLQDVAKCQGTPQYEGYFMTVFMVPVSSKDR